MNAPASLDAFEQRRLLTTLLLLQWFASETAAVAPEPTRVVRAARGAASPARGRRHVRPARSC